MKVVTFKIYEDLLERLDKYAEERGLTRSDAIRMAIREMLDGNNRPRHKYIIKKIIIT